MASPTKQAYKIIFNQEPPAEMKDWEIAREVMNNWNVPKMGEELAQDCIFEIVDVINFPTEELRIEVVGLAENMSTELFPELAGKDEPHMDDIAVLKEKYYLKRLEKENREFKKPR